MKITCQSCQSKYNVADEKVRGKIVKIRCRKCGATIVVHGTEGATTNGSAPAPAPAAPAPAAEGEWHVNLGETDQRAMSLAELVEAYNSSIVTQDTFIWTDGMDDWKPLAEVDVVVNALHENAAATAAAEPAYAAPIDAPAEPEPEAPAAKPLDVRGGYPSAFDDGTPMAAAAAPEAKRAAVRREGGRGRDLFGGGGGLGAEEVQTSAPAMAQALGAATDGQGQLTGQRNENSVLFSLAVLTKNADERAPSQPPPSRSNEDSGLIDLKALAARAESNRPPALAADGGAFSAPIGISAPLGAPLGALSSPFGGAEPPAKSKLPLYIGGGAGMVLLLVVGVFIGAKIAASAAPAPVPVASIVPVATTAEPTAATPAPTAEASASASPSATVAAKPKPVYHAPAGGGAKPTAGGAAPTPAGTATGAATNAPTPPPPKKPGNDCGCNGDLMCLMKCSTH